MPHEQVGPALTKKRLTGPPEHVRERGLRIHFGKSCRVHGLGLLVSRL